MNSKDWDGLNAEAAEMVLQIVNGNRQEVRDFVENHETPGKLLLAMVRHLGSHGSEEYGFASYLHATVNLQGLTEGMNV